jgi:exonuclease VII large subunit
LATLSRGFTIVKSLPDETIVRHAGQLKVGQEINNQFTDGQVVSRVISVQSNNDQ